MLDAKVAELAAVFAARAGEERAWLGKALETADIETLRDRAHKLAGIAGMFGFPEVGEAALQLELAAESGRDVRGEAAVLDALLARILPQG